MGQKWGGILKFNSLVSEERKFVPDTRRFEAEFCTFAAQLAFEPNQQCEHRVGQ